MRIIEIRESTVPLAGDVANSVVDFTGHTVSLVALVSNVRRGGRPVVGFGFNSIGRFGQAGILRERMIPRVLSAQPDELLTTGIDGSERLDPAAVAMVAMRNEKPGGHGDRAGAVAALELAAWDLDAKLRDEPAHTTIATRYGTAAQETASTYAAGGYYRRNSDVRSLRDELTRYRDLGFDACKIKIGGLSLGDDLRRIEAALDVVGAGSSLAIDANGRFDLDTALAYGRAIEPFGLRWFEEPCGPLDYSANAALIDGYRGAVATGENLFGTADALNLIRYGGMRPGLDVFQMDPGLSYGITEFAATVRELEAAGFDRRQCVPHGGHLVNLHVVVGLGLGGCEAYPDVFRPFGGYPPECRPEAGRIRPPDAPGFGLESKRELRPHLDALAGS